jgi:ribonuclease-3
VPPVSGSAAERAQQLVAKLGLDPAATELVALALTHPSRRHESGDPGDNERLEFLGDAILGAVISAALYEADSAASEGDLSERRAGIVSRQSLAEVAERLKLDEAIYLSLGESERGGARRPAALAAVLEALIGAIYLSLGFAAAAAFVQAQLAPEIAAPRALLGKGIKTMLQEWTQARNGSLPRYDIVATSGPEHDRIYECVVRVDGGEVARGSGPSRRAAEAAAAEAAIDILGVTAGATA